MEQEITAHKEEDSLSRKAEGNNGETVLDREALTWMRDIADDLNELFVIRENYKASGKPVARRVMKSSALHYFWLAPEHPLSPEHSLFDSFRKALFALLNRPHLRLVETRKWIDPAEVEEVDDDDPIGINDWYCGVSDSIPARERKLTRDNPEHRTIVAFLRKLESAARSLGEQIDELMTRNSEHEEFLKNAGKILLGRQRQVRALHALPLLEDVPPGIWPPEPTSVFINDPLYRRVFDLMMTFERMPDLHEKANQLLLAVITCEPWRLFELWCLFRARDALRKYTHKEEKNESWFDEDGSLRLKWGKQKEVKLRWPGGISLKYQLTCPNKCPNHKQETGFWSLAITVYPDLIIDFRDWFIIMDPKNWSARSLGHDPEQRKKLIDLADKGMGKLQPMFPWDQAHRYQNCIRYGSSAHRAKGSFLLIPYREEPDKKVEIFFRPEGWGSYGFGAIQLQKSKDEAGRDLAEFFIEMKRRHENE